MKKRILLPLTTALAALFLFASCDKVKDAIKINFDASSSDIRFTIPPIEESGEATLADNNVYLNIDSLIKSQSDEIGVENIKSVNIKECIITLENGDSINHFGIFESCKIELASDTKTELVTIAEINDNPETESFSMNMPIKSDVNLAEYFHAKNYTYKLIGKTRRGTTIELQCNVSATYNIVAGL